MKIRNYSLILVTFLSSALTAQEQYQAPPAQVSIARAESKFMAPTTLVSGSVLSLNDSKISNQVAGQLTWLSEVGTNVKKGQPIAEIDNTRYRLAERTAEARIDSLQADLKFRQQEVTRLNKLATSNNASKARLQEETAKLAMLSADIKAAKANLNAVQYDLAQTKVAAPFDGIITQRYASLGEFVLAGNQLLRLVATNQPEITINVPIELLQHLKLNEQLQAISNTLSETVLIKSIVPVGDSVSRMINIRLKPTSPNWVIGASVNVLVPNAKPQQRIAFPRDAIIIKGSNLYIFRIADDQTAEQIKATVVATDGPLVAIEASLSEGDRIVIRGGERLMPGQKVAILPSKPPSN